MADHVSSKSKKRRTKNQRKKLKKANEKLEEDSTENYAVDFPETATSKVKIKVKSKSLDDDEDSVKIQEVTECCEGERQECEAIISEADSDWEEANTLKLPQEPVALSTIAITIDEEPLQRLEGFSPEEELSLRNFLETINLVNAPETPVTTSTLDTIKKEKSRKRDALIKYFKPLVHNPRYLDIISEESSDLSDRETPSLTQHLKQGTPELEYPIKSSPKVIRRRKQGQARNEEKAVLVCTKLVETPSIVEHFHSCATENIEAEKVFLDTSSEYTSSKNSSDSEESNDEVKMSMI
ncbi:hypothetical protein HHI36_012941 [Cryptolaemus montrouzieri]|uniref:Uncharacterized protein n=1 Tax=Cryptolaemus montrouzieri TaxID=559131 RepID=A0ABD2NG92_9CUCU